MRKKVMYIILVGVMSVIMVACSSGESYLTESSSDVAPEEVSLANENDSYVADQFSDNVESNQAEFDGKNTQRMIIYNANLSIDVENYLETQQKIEQILLHMNGYIVNSSVYRHSEQNISANLDVRIPQAQFTIFLEQVEALSIKVTNRNISGTDVTEEYVDLESRLKSKEVVEERLLGFMEKAEQTEDLLKISDDLAKIQENIEQIKGRMNYLQNHSSLASVSISINEEKITVPEFNNENLNVWIKTKEQFVNSLNGIIHFFSNLFIFFVGNSPVLIILGLITIAVLLFIRRYRKKED